MGTRKEIPRAWMQFSISPLTVAAHRKAVSSRAQDDRAADDAAATDVKRDYEGLRPRARAARYQCLRDVTRNEISSTCAGYESVF